MGLFTDGQPITPLVTEQGARTGIISIAASSCVSWRVPTLAGCKGTTGTSKKDMHALQAVRAGPIEACIAKYSQAAGMCLSAVCLRARCRSGAGGRGQAHERVGAFVQYLAGRRPGRCPTRRSAARGVGVRWWSSPARARRSGLEIDMHSSSSSSACADVHADAASCVCARN